MKTLSTLIAASALAIIPLTGAQAEWEDPRYYNSQTLGLGSSQGAFVHHQRAKVNRTAKQHRVTPTRSSNKRNFSQSKRR